MATTTHSNFVLKTKSPEIETKLHRGYPFQKTYIPLLTASRYCRQNNGDILNILFSFLVKSKVWTTHTGRWTFQWRKQTSLITYVCHKHHFMSYKSNQRSRVDVNKAERGVCESTAGWSARQFQFHEIEFQCGMTAVHKTAPRLLFEFQKLESEFCQFHAVSGTKFPKQRCSV